MKCFYYNLDDAEFVTAAGEKIPRCVPELFYQEHAEWRIHLRDRDNAPRDLDGIVAWSAAVDCDYLGSTSPMCRSFGDDITCDAETGAVTVAVDAATSEFLAAVDGSSKRRAYFELCGLNQAGERTLQLAFEIAARMIIDPDPEVDVHTPDTVATKAYTSAVVSTLVDSACANLGQVVSGAAVDAAATAVSGAVFSGREFDTVIGDTRITATSSGGVVVQVGGSGGATVRVSSGAVVASGASGESVVLSGGEIAAVASSYDEEASREHIMSFGLTSSAAVVSGNGEISATASDEYGDHQAHVTITSGGVNISISDPTNGIDVSVAPGAVGITGNNGDEGAAVTVNSRPVLTELVTSTDTTTTSASFEVLEGGTSYIYTQPLTALTFGSITSDARAEFDFTAASGAQIGLPSGGGVKLAGSSSLDGGAHYWVAVNGARVVVVPYIIIGE